MTNNLQGKNQKYPKGHFLGMWMGLSIAIFTGIGIPLCIISNNFGLIGIGPGIGVAIGFAIGQSIENKYQKEGRIRPLTAAEIKRRKIAVAGGITILTLGVLIFLCVLFNCVLL